MTHHAYQETNNTGGLPPVLPNILMAGSRNRMIACLNLFKKLFFSWPSITLVPKLCDCLSILKKMVCTIRNADDTLLAVGGSKIFYATMPMTEKSRAAKKRLTYMLCKNYKFLIFI